jgi:peptidoglycan hydrolase CwlO-like protein
MNLQDMLDEYINFKIQEVLDVALANKKKTITKELESVRGWLIELEHTLDDVKTLADANEYNIEDFETRIGKLEDDTVQLNQGVIKSQVREILTKSKLTVE